MLVAVFWLVVVLIVVSTIVGVVWFRVNRAKVKGLIGELRVRFLHLGRLDSRVYTVFHDVTLPRPDSKGTTQIDHVVISRFGVVVIETKNMGGWIFGSENAKNWTVTYRSGKKVRFQNPLRQNYLHARALAEYCDLDPDLIQSLVFLAGDGQPKTMTDMGPNVIYRYGLDNRIKRQQNVQPDQQTVSRCILRLSARQQGTSKRSARKAHVEALNARLRN